MIIIWEKMYTYIVQTDLSKSKHPFRTVHRFSGFHSDIEKLFERPILWLPRDVATEELEIV